MDDAHKARANGLEDGFNLMIFCLVGVEDRLGWLDRVLGDFEGGEGRAYA